MDTYHETKEKQMNVKELQQKSDKELNFAYSFLKDFICQQLEILPEEFENDVEKSVNQQSYKARYTVKKVRYAINELETIFSTLHIQVTEDTLAWSSMEDTRFNTTDTVGLENIINKAFAN